MTPPVHQMTMTVSLADVEPVRRLISASQRWADERKRRREFEGATTVRTGTEFRDVVGSFADCAAREAKLAVELEQATNALVETIHSHTQ